MGSGKNDIYKTFKLMRNSINRASINESDEGGGAIPYSKNDQLYKDSVNPCKTVFGADFSKLEKCMLYYPSDGDITLSGIIPSLNNAKFQFRYLDPSGNGCFIWLDSIQLNDETIRHLNRVFGVYKNWKSKLSTIGDESDLLPMGYKKEN